MGGLIVEAEDDLRRSFGDLNARARNPRTVPCGIVSSQTRPHIRR